MAPDITLESASQYAVGWIAALAHERAAAKLMLDEEHNAPKDFVPNGSDQNSYTWGKIGKHNVVVAQLPAGEYGTVSAADTASGMRASLPDIRVGLLVGIGAGIPGEKLQPDGSYTVKRDILLGDVVVSNPDGTNGGVVQYDLYKAKTLEDGRTSKERKGFLNSPPRALRAALGHLQADHEIEDSKVPEFLEQAWKQRPKIKGPYGYPGSDKDHLRSAESRQYPQIHYGTILSGNVLEKSTKDRDNILQWLSAENIDPLCFEMEASGLMNSFPCLVIRGICDYANEHKSDAWQRYAALTAAAFAKEYLQYVQVREVQLAPKIAEVLENIHLKVEHVDQNVQQLVNTNDTRQRNEAREKVLGWLNSPNSRPPANVRREPGTILWFFESESFSSWVSGRQPCLFIHGGVGCGKTTLNRAIVDELSEDQVISFYFNSSANEQFGLNALLRYLVANLCRPNTIPDLLQQLYDRHNKSFPPEPPNDDEELQAVIDGLLKDEQLNSQQKRPCYILIDGLDEISPKSRRRSVTGYLQHLVQTRPPNLRILVTSRPAGLTSALHTGWCQLPIPAHRVRSDIELYVSKRVAQQPELTTLDAMIRNQIIDRLAGPGQTMFRYAYLQLERLLDSGLLLGSDVSMTLRNLPSTLNETYDAILKDIDEIHQKLALTALRWLTFAERPLTISELLAACAIDLSEHGTLNDDWRLTPAQLLALLPNLVSVDISQQTDSDGAGLVSFGHFSVKEYLLEGMSTALQPRYNMDSTDGHSVIASSCIAYLFRTNTMTLSDYPFALRDYAFDFWYIHAVGGSLCGEDALHRAETLYHGISSGSGTPTGLQHLLYWLPTSEDSSRVMDSLRHAYFFDGTDREIYETLAQNEFRVVQLRPSPQRFTVPRCKMSTMSLDSYPIYDAMSYSWGGRFYEKRYNIYVNGKGISVGRNLLNNLVNLRDSSHRVQMLWIDAICINQDSMEDKSCQVPIMPQIFSNATRVAVCLGDAQSGDSWALAVADALAGLIREYSLQQFEALCVLLNSSMNPLWDLKNLFDDHEWYGRIWVIQEFVLGKNPVILYGPHMLTYETLHLLTSNSAEALRYLNLAAPDRKLKSNILFRSIRWQQVTGCTRLRHCKQTGIILSASQTLFASRFHIYTEPRDRFYSLFDICSVFKAVEANYFTPLASLCKEVTLTSIQTELTLDLFTMKCTCMQYDNDHSAWAGQEERDIPSWASMYHCRSEDCPVPLLHKELGLVGNSGLCAGGTSFSVVPGIDDSGNLHLRGCLVEVIKDIPNPTFKQLGHIDSTLYHKRKMCRTVDGRRGFVPMRAKTGHLIAVLIGGKTPYVLEETETLAHNLPDSSTSTSRSGILRNLRQISSSMLSSSRDRLSITSARKGLLDDQNQALRTYKLIGECYIEGIMHGEILEAAKENQTYDIGTIVLV